MVAPRGDPRVAGFFDALDAINSLAEGSPGFVWRLQDEAGDATNIQTTVDPLLLINVSVWSDVESLFDYVYRSDHTTFLAGRKEWFEPLGSVSTALWWVPRGHRPNADEGFAKLWHLDRFGPSPYAFTFKSRFASPG